MQPTLNKGGGGASVTIFVTDCRFDTFDTSSYELDRPFPKVKNKKVNGLMKDELAGKIMTTFVGLRANTYTYLIDDASDNKNAISAS